MAAPRPSLPPAAARSRVLLQQGLGEALGLRLALGLALGLGFLPFKATLWRDNCGGKPTHCFVL
jgi:hypothetical protein